MNHTPINLVIAINRLYVKYAYVMLYSFLCHHPEPVSVYILHHELTPEDESTLQTLSQQFAVHISLVYVPDSLLPPPEVLKTGSWGIEAYFDHRSSSRFGRPCALPGYRHYCKCAGL